MGYRADIDGLRAIAVLAIVAFHYRVGTVFGGGYVGVDVFFVISGYLIAGMIARDMDARRYSVLEFYQRRARRIFPALFVVLLATLILSWFLGFPSEIRATGEGVVASLLFLSNVHFYRTSSYFGDLQAWSPVLHTWSLSIEEQFYVLFPVVLLLVRRARPRWRFWVLALLLALSLAVSALEVHANSGAAFYLLPSRAWELLLGALLAERELPPLTTRIGSELLAWSGLAAIAAAICTFGAETRFPGLMALLPCLGAAAIIHAGARNDASLTLALSSAPLRFVGLISFSFYLWHWPLFVFYSTFFNPDGVQKTGLLAVAIALSTLTWWFVERPARQRPFKFSPRLTLGCAALAALPLIALAASLGPLAEVLRPLDPAARATLAYQDGNPYSGLRAGTCFMTAGVAPDAMLDRQACASLSPTRRNVLLVGDSLAAHLWQGFDATYPDVNFMQVTASGCRPLLPLVGAPRCTRALRFALEEFIPAHRVDVIVLASRWQAGDVPQAIALAQRMAHYAGSVVILGPVETYARPLPHLLAAEMTYGVAPGTFAYRFLDVEPQAADAAFKRQMMPPGVVYVSAQSMLCRPSCLLRTPGGAPLQFDNMHFTQEGSALFARLAGAPILGGMPDGHDVSD